MRQQYQQDNRKWWLISLSIIGILIIGVGIVLYHNFFRQNNARLIETVPENAAFIFEINDNISFVKSTLVLDDYLDELFAFDAFPGFQSFIDQSQLGNDQSSIISGHSKNDKLVLLFSIRMDERVFKSLLKTLKIDARNYVSFENTQIYSYGTHFKKFNFVFHNNIFSVSEDIDLLKQSIVKLRIPHNLLSDKQFKKLYNLTEKNTKQNWLIVNHEVYTNMMVGKVADEYQDLFFKIKNISTWSAYQIRLIDKEIHLDGYTLDDAAFVQKFEGQGSGEELPVDIIPFNANFYINVQTPNFNKFSKEISQLYAKENVAQETLNHLKNRSSYFFSLSKDTSTYYYFTIPIDTIAITFDQLRAADQTEDSTIHFKQFDIYKANLGGLGMIYTLLHENANLTYFTEYQNHYIFAQTPDVLKYYFNNILNNSIGNNPYYKLSRSNMPSEVNFEFFYYNKDEADKMTHFFSKTSQKSVLRDMKVLTYSMSAPVNGVATTNILIKF